MKTKATEGKTEKGRKDCRMLGFDIANKEVNIENIDPGTEQYKGSMDKRTKDYVNSDK